MAPGKKGKGGKGTEMSLSEFQGNVQQGGEHDWAESQWEPEQQAHFAGTIPGEERKTDGTVLHSFRYNHDRTKLGTETNFRDASSKVPDDMPPPYVAHLGNLKTGISKEVLCEEFFPDKIKECKLITRDERSTFAFIEFEDVRTLQLVLLMNERVVLGRKVRIDVASPEQIARMAGHGNKGRGGFGSVGGGDSTLGLDSLDRDTFGTGSPVTQGLGRNFMGNKQASGNAPVATDAFAGFRSEPQMQQMGSMQDFGNWREEGETEKQPSFQFEGKGGRGRNRGSPTAAGAPSFGRARSTQDLASPTSAGGADWNFRDGPHAAQPSLPAEGAPATAPPKKRNTKEAEEGEGRQGFGMNAQQSPVSAGGNKRFGGNNNNNNAPRKPKEQTPTPAPAPAPTPAPTAPPANAWSKSFLKRPTDDKPTPENDRFSK